MKSKTRGQAMQTLILLAAFFGATGVALGAFGAHGLSDLLETNGRVDTFRTGAQYHLIHAAVILATAFLVTQIDSQLISHAGWAFAIGILFFSGSLYILSIFDISIMGAVAPIGGTAFIIGWVLLGVAAFQSA
ncbi:MAG: DUF423 domain-containing protein [Chloroflexota bacterium]